MGTFAEFECNIIRKRQAEGIAKAKERGVYKNRKRKPVIDRDEVRKLKAEGLSTYKIADQMGISRMSVHRILNNAAWCTKLPSSHGLNKLTLSCLYEALCEAVGNP